MNLIVTTILTNLFLLSICFARQETMDCSILDELNFDFIKVPGGEFIQTGVDGEKKVVIFSSRYFAVAKYETTQLQWQLLMGENPSYFANPSKLQYPVENISWYDIQIFLARLNQLEATCNGWGTTNKSSFIYDLPTVSEWEYVASAGTSSFYKFENDYQRVDGDQDNLGWTMVNSGDSTHQVGLKPANKWGFFDLYGNVQEFCKNSWIPDARRVDNKTSIDPIGPRIGGSPITMGGSFRDQVWKFLDGASTRYRATGFRLIRFEFCFGCDG